MGGVPSNRVTAFAGQSGVGKTFFAISVVNQFLKDNPDGAVFYFDTEFALEKIMFEKRGVDVKHLFLSQPDTIQHFTTMVLKLLSNLENSEDRPKVMIVLDSLGNLPSQKEMEDLQSGKYVRDMTKQQAVRSFFRTTLKKLGKLDVPMIVTNHTYDVIGCLTENHLVEMDTGEYKSIRNVKEGDKVRTLNGISEVVGEYMYFVEDTITFELENGETIECTKDHKFMLEDGTWKKAEDLNVEDVLKIV